MRSNLIKGSVNNDFCAKIIVIGDSEVGKTAILNRAVHDKFH